MLIRRRDYITKNNNYEAVAFNSCVCFHTRTRCFVTWQREIHCSIKIWHEEVSQKV